MFPLCEIVCWTWDSEERAKQFQITKFELLHCVTYTYIFANSPDRSKSDRSDEGLCLCLQHHWGTLCLLQAQRMFTEQIKSKWIDSEHVDLALVSFSITACFINLFIYWRGSHTLCSLPWPQIHSTSSSSFSSALRLQTWVTIPGSAYNFYTVLCGGASTVTVSSTGYIISSSTFFIVSRIMVIQRYLCPNLLYLWIFLYMAKTSFLIWLIRTLRGGEIIMDCLCGSSAMDETKHGIWKSERKKEKKPSLRKAHLLLLDLQIGK